MKAVLIISLLSLLLASSSVASAGSSGSGGDNEGSPPPPGPSVRRLMPMKSGLLAEPMGGMRQIPEALRRCPGRGCPGGCCLSKGFVCCADRKHCAREEAECPEQEVEVEVEVEEQEEQEQQQEQPGTARVQT